MNEPTKHEIAVLQLAYDAQEKADHDEWLYQQKLDKIEQNHDFLGEIDNQENEEE